jgi:hypothetical protein
MGRPRWLGLGAAPWGTTRANYRRQLPPLTEFKPLLPPPSPGRCPPTAT